MIILDLADDILGIVEEHLHAARKRQKIKYFQKAYIPTHAVLYSWRNDAPYRARHLNLSTNGQELFSYALKIGLTEGNTKVLLNYTALGGSFVSHTTSTHVNKSREYSDKVIMVF
jgi:hypothetical protein